MLLDHEDETTRFYAVWALSIIGRDAQALWPRLLKMFAKDEDEEVRVKSVFALTRIAPDSNEVLTAFVNLAGKKGNTSPERSAAIDELQHFGKSALAPLVQAMQDEDVYMHASQSFNHLLENNENDTFGQAALPYLGEILINPHLFVAYDFPGDAFTLVLSKHGEKLLLALQKKLTDKNPRTQQQGMWALAQIAANLAAHGENPDLVKKVIKLLLPSFRSPDVEVRRTVAWTAPWHPDTETAFEGLLLDEVFRDAEIHLRRQGAILIPIWTECYKAAKGDDKLRYAAMLRPWEQNQEVLDLMWANLQHKDPAIRHRMACALADPDRSDAGKIKKLIPVLLESLQSVKVEQRLQAAGALSQIRLRPAAPERLPLLDDHAHAILDRLDDPSPKVRMALLCLLNPRTKADRMRTLKLMEPLLNDKDAGVRWALVWVLSSLGKEGMPLLVQLLQREKDAMVLEHACDLLAWMDRDAQAAVPAILRLAETEEHWQAASYALFRIAPERSFAGLLDILKKRDETLRKTITYPPAVYENPSKLIDAMLKDWKKSDLAQSRPIIHALLTIQPLLPTKDHNGLVLGASPLLSEHLVQVQKALKARAAKDRLEAIAVLGLLRQLHALHNWGIDLTEKERTEFQERHGRQLTLIDELLLQARRDCDVQVRRQARKVQSIEVMLVSPDFLRPPPTPYFSPPPSLRGTRFLFTPGGFGPAFTPKWTAAA